MARGRVPRPVREPVPDEVRCTPTTTTKVRSSFQRRLLGGTILAQHLTQSRFQFRQTKARSQLKPLKFLLRPTKPRSQLKPLRFYKRRKTLLLNPGANRELPLSPGVFGASTAPIQGSTDTANQNPSSVVEDLVPANAGTNEGTPNSEASVSATENYNADPNPNSSPNGFQKTASIWQAVEKLKVFSQAPQRPHFTKLQSLCPEMREGIALGLMVTYANLTDSIKNLSYDDDVALIMEKISCLNPLEENGFDVGQYRARLRQLLYIKAEYTDSESQISRLEVQLAEKEKKLASLKKVQLEMGDVSREINLFKERINFLMVKRDRLLDLTVGNGHEISRLKEEISNLRLNASARQEFASLLVKPL